jgi:hypothetical protein
MKSNIGEMATFSRNMHDLYTAKTDSELEDEDEKEE